MRATPRLKESAHQLVAYAAAEGAPARGQGSATFRVCELVRQRLIKVMGVGGFRTLLARSLALAGDEVPWLRALHIRADGSLEGLEDLRGKLDPQALAEGEVLLISHLLGLLVTFIGPALTLGLMHDIWPRAAGLNFGEENRHDET